MILKTKKIHINTMSKKYQISKGFKKELISYKIMS